jgi:CheY-like chemotaxis protein
LEAVLDSVNVGEVYRYLRKPWKPDTIRSTISLAATTYLLRTQKKGQQPAPVAPQPEPEPEPEPELKHEVMPISLELPAPKKKYGSFEEEFFATMSAETELDSDSQSSVTAEQHAEWLPAASQAEQQMLGRSGKAKVLVIDDEEHVLSAITELLSKEFDVIGCKSPATALDIIHANPFIAVVISDQRMPQMSGVDFLIEAQRLAPDIPKILLTGQIDAEDVIRLVNEGQVFRYLSKPWDVARLKETLHSAVDLCKIKLNEKNLKEQEALKPEAALHEAEKPKPQIELQNLQNLASLFQKKS